MVQISGPIDPDIGVHVDIEESTSAPDQPGPGVVLQCDASDCIHNKGQRCMAGSIYVTFVRRIPQCDTYTVASEDMQELAGY